MGNCGSSCKVKYGEFASEQLYTWCTNCGNYGISAAVKRALVAEEISPKDVLLCFDIGCNGNESDKIGGYTFHGLHGRVLPFAAGACLANRKVKVVASAGDGATLSEGINHLIHSIRSNYNFAFILHDNSNYGLTTGQASATTRQDQSMNSSPDGPTADTLIPMNLVLSLNPTFAARTFSGDVKHMTEIFRRAIRHNGFAYVEVMQSCPTYNKATPHEWYMNHVYDVESLTGYDRFNISQAKHVANDVTEHVAIGVLYENLNSKDFYNRQPNRVGIETDLVDEVLNYDVQRLVDKFKY